MLDSFAGPTAWPHVRRRRRFRNTGNLSDILFEEGRSLNYHVVDHVNEESERYI
jgi:hypothetical protein